MKLSNNFSEDLQEESNIKISNLKNNVDEEYKTHYYSYFVLAIFMLQNYIYGTFLTSLGSLIDIFNNLYGIGSSGIALTNSLLSISFVIFSIPLSFLSKLYGLRFSILLADILFIIGSILRLFINKSSVIFYIGFIFLGIGSPLITNSQLKLIKSWVPPNKRNILNSLLFITSPIGAGTGPILPLLFVNKNEMNKNILKSQIFNFFLFNLIILIFLFILSFFFLHDKPKDGYGKINKTKNLSKKKSSLKDKKKKFFDDIKFILKEVKFNISCFIFGLSLTTITIIGTNINPILEPFERSAFLGLITNILAIVSGLISAFLFSLFLQVKISNKFAIQILFLIAYGGMLICLIGIILGYNIMIYLGAILVGGGVFSHCSVIIEYLTKKFFKVNFFIINSLLFISQQFLQSIFIYLVGYFVSYEVKFYSILSCSLISLFYFLIILASVFLK